MLVQSLVNHWRSYSLSFLLRLPEVVPIGFEDCGVEIAISREVVRVVEISSPISLARLAKSPSDEMGMTGLAEVDRGPDVRRCGVPHMDLNGGVPDILSSVVDGRQSDNPLKLTMKTSAMLTRCSQRVVDDAAVTRDDEEG